MWIHQMIKEWLSHLCDMAVDREIKILEKFIQKFKPVRVVLKHENVIFAFQFSSYLIGQWMFWLAICLSLLF